MLRFISFGSGSSGNCYFLISEEGGLLIDAGIGIRSLKKYFKDYGLSMQSIGGILVTHDHADHVKSVGNLSSELQVPVYTTRQVHEGIRRNRFLTHRVEEPLKRFLNKGEALELGPFRVTPFAVPHDSADNVGYLIEHGETNFCIVTDAGHITDEIKPFINKAIHLVIEANHDEQMLITGHYPPLLKQRILGDRGHLSNSACAKALEENMGEGLRNVWLCHLSEENNHPELARKTVEAALKDRDVNLEVLKRKAPTGIFILEQETEQNECRDRQDAQSLLH